MKRNLLTLSLLLVSISILSQTSRDQIHYKKAVELYVAFNPELNFNNSNDYIYQAIKFIPKLNDIKKKIKFSLKKGIPVSDDKLDIMAQNIIK